MKLLFLHGWHSVPGGVKPTYLKDHGHEVLNPALDDDDFTLAVKTAQADFDKHQPQVVVGSSRGGAVAMNIKSGAAKLVLLCPAWKKFGKARTVKADTVILHSRADDVVPFADSEDLAKNSGATLIEVGTDHRLADPEPLAAMLEACVHSANKTGMNSIIELHDSRLIEIVSCGSSVVVRFGPAYVHRSALRPGFDPGSVWTQDFDLIVEEAVLESGFTELPCDLDGGSLSVGKDIFENIVPNPLDVHGDIRFSATNLVGESFVMSGTRIVVRPVGEARYVEQFPGNK
jgi:hypothetical protein